MFGVVFQCVLAERSDVLVEVIHRVELSFNDCSNFLMISPKTSHLSAHKTCDNLTHNEFRERI